VALSSRGLSKPPVTETQLQEPIKWLFPSPFQPLFINKHKAGEPEYKIG
jgi:hypothetical protein